MTCAEVLALLILSLAALWMCHAQDVRDEACGTTRDLALRVERCSKALVDILEGNVEKWPQNENDSKELCAKVSDKYIMFHWQPHRSFVIQN